jgi:hypothetical protein
MAEPLVDFQCYVGKYVIMPFAKLPEKYRPYDGPANMPHLLQVGPAKLIRPSHRVLSYAVGLLLQTKMPNWWACRGEIDPADPEIRDHIWSNRLAIWDDEDDLDPEEFSKLERNVLLIARHIGMLMNGGPDPQTISEDPDSDDWSIYQESLEKWIDLAGWIQRVFTIREHEKDFDLPVGPLSVFLSSRPRQPISMHIRPSCTLDALLYIAAGMIARGTTVQTCDNCDKPFLEGGERGGRSKKRAGSRFCSDKCRYEYHNEERRKAKSKSK